MGKVSRLVQAAQLALRIGDYHVGVRSNSHPVVEQMTSLLAPHVVEDPAAPANYSIYEPSPTLHTARPVYRVYEGCSRVFFTPSLLRSVVATVGQLERLLPDVPPSLGVLGLRVLALVDSEAAVLAPDGLLRRVPTLELQLRRRGMRVLSTASVLVDAGRGDLLIRPLRLIAGGATGATGDPVVDGTDPAQPGRRRIVGWFFDTDGTVPPDLTRAQAVVQGLKAARAPTSDAESLELLAQLIRRLDVRALPTEAMAASAVDLLGAHPTQLW